MDAEVAVSLRFHFVQGIGESRRETSQLSRRANVIRYSILGGVS